MKQSYVTSGRRAQLATLLTRGWICVAAIPLLVLANPGSGYGADPECHSNPNAAQDMQTVLDRADVKNLPAPLKTRLANIAGGPHSYLPVQAFAEADLSSKLFQYYLLDTTGFEPNVFTAVIPGVNDTAMKTATGANCDAPTMAAVRLVVEPKPGLPTDPKDPRAFIDVFTDISGLFVINNESGWYEGWMIHDLHVPSLVAPRRDGHAQFGTMTAEDAALLRRMGTGTIYLERSLRSMGRPSIFPTSGTVFPTSRPTSFRSS